MKSNLRYKKKTFMMSYIEFKKYSTLIITNYPFAPVLPFVDHVQCMEKSSKFEPSFRSRTFTIYHR